MEDRYLGKYRNRTNRQLHFDYGSANDYFITLVVKNRINSFGRIENGEMIHSELGEIVRRDGCEPLRSGKR